MAVQITKLQNVVKLYAILLVVWGFYRVLFKLPDVIEELVLKPVLWLGLLYWFLQKEGVGFSSVGWTSKNLFASIYLGVGAGILFALVGVLGNVAKYGGSPDFADFGFTDKLLLGSLGVSFVTAVSEETVFRGYLFTRLGKILKSAWMANILTSIGWAIIHLPVQIFVYDMVLGALPARFLLSLLFSLGAGFIYGRTGNILAPVLLNVFWSWPIILFR